MKYRIEPLNKGHDRRAFSCGNEALDNYFYNQVTQDTKRRITSCFVSINDDGCIVGFFTLASSSIPLQELPKSFHRKLPRYPTVPAVILGRLAVDYRHRGLGLGRHLIIGALDKLFKSEIAVYALIVNAKDESAQSFYYNLGFKPLVDQPLKMYLPLKIAEERLKK